MGTASHGMSLSELLPPCMHKLPHGTSACSLARPCALCAVQHSDCPACRHACPALRSLIALRPAVHNGRMDGSLHGLQRGGPQSMDLMYSPVDDLDDDVGIVDAEVLELLLSRPSL